MYVCESGLIDCPRQPCCSDCSSCQQEPTAALTSLTNTHFYILASTRIIALTLNAETHRLTLNVQSQNTQTHADRQLKMVCKNHLHDGPYRKNLIIIISKRGDSKRRERTQHSALRHAYYIDTRPQMGRKVLMRAQ